MEDARKRCSGTPLSQPSAKRPASAATDRASPVSDCSDSPYDNGDSSRTSPEPSFVADAEPPELVELGEAYARATGYPIQYQWTLLQGLNDGDDELEGIARLLAGKYAIMNFIPYNAVDGLPYARPSWERAAAMAGYLNKRGVLTRLRRSAGQDVEAGCGQLRARASVTR